MTMKKLIAVFVPVLMLFASARVEGQPGGPPHNTPDTIVDVDNNVSSNQYQDVSVSNGGDASSKSSSSSGASINTTSISNYRTRTEPITTFPPTLPYWSHGGWGTIEAYFPNGLNNDVQVYEQIFDPDNPDDIRRIRGVLKSLPYESPLGVIGGFLNCVGAIFGGPDNFHHGRGFEIASSLVRTRRPEGKPLIVFIDTNVDTMLLKRAGYAYVGKVSIEGKVERNWDHVYDAAVAEALPWDVDILLISGGMKGVTVGSNIAFPGAGGAYSQANYAISLFGSVSSGITEGKGKALVSAAGYRFSPELALRRRIPKAFYKRFQTKHTARPSREIDEPVIVREAAPPKTFTPMAPPPTTTPAISVRKAPPALAPKRNHRYPGVEVSRQLYDMAGFGGNQRVENVIIR
jgi:hypothetical protein